MGTRAARPQDCASRRNPFESSREVRRDFPFWARNQKALLDEQGFRIGAQKRTRSPVRDPGIAPAGAILSSPHGKSAGTSLSGPRNEKALLVEQGFRIGAQKRTRTSTVLPPLGPEPSASTNSAIWASSRSMAAAMRAPNSTEAFGICKRFVAAIRVSCFASPDRHCRRSRSDCGQRVWRGTSRCRRGAAAAPGAGLPARRIPRPR